MAALGNRRGGGAGGGALRAAVVNACIRHQYESERAARAEAERANQTKEDFVAVISHDLRDPLSSISINMQLLKKLLAGNANSAVPSVIASTERALQQMLALVSGLLDLAQAESGNMQVDSAPTSANTLIQNAAELIRPLAERKRIVLDTSAPDGAIIVECDEKRILQVLSNLLGNAVKFTPEQGSIRMQVEASAHGATISVSDSGPGIPVENLPHLFDRFWQAQRSPGRGIGLGLSIVKAIIDAHGSQITVSNGPAGGAHFAFTLRRAA